MRSDGILGNTNEQGVKAGTSERIKWLKRRERWLVVLGVILHAVYMLSIFDIYFKSPIVRGVDLVAPRFSAPAKRLVLLVGTYAFTQNAHTNCLMLFILSLLGLVVFVVVKY